MNDRLKFRIWDGEKFYFTTDKVDIFPAGFSDTFGLFFGISPNKRLKPDTLNYSKNAKITIQQFTGLTDSTGKEIYEGDIFNGGTYKWDAVEFQDGKFVANLRGARLYDLCELFDGDWNRKPEIAGNVFETPELLQ